MNRRSFLKFIPAGVLGAKQAAAQAAEKLAFGVGEIGLEASSATDMPMGGIAGSGDYAGYARKRLAQMLTPWWQELRRRGISVSRLDPDLASMRSLSLSVRMQMQRDRNFERIMADERAHYEGALSGLFD